MHSTVKLLMNTAQKRIVMPISDPAYFTGNPHYYKQLQHINGLMRQHKIAFVNDTSNIDQSAIKKWKALEDMETSLNMRLTSEQYFDLTTKLSLLNAVEHKDDALVKLLECYLPVGKELVEFKPEPATLDDKGRSYTTASRKTAKAQCWMVPGNGSIYVNGVSMIDYFPFFSQREAIVKPFVVADRLARYNVWSIVHCGGSTGQSEALAVAVARGISVHEPELTELLDSNGLRTIDVRQVERKKTNQPKARKKHAWVKR